MENKLVEIDVQWPTNTKVDCHKHGVKTISVPWADDQVDLSGRFYAIVGLAYLGYAEAFDDIEKALIQDHEEKTEYFQHLKRMNQDRAKVY